MRPVNNFPFHSSQFLQVDKGGFIEGVLLGDFPCKFGAKIIDVLAAKVVSFSLCNQCIGPVQSQLASSPATPVKQFLG